MARDVCRDCEEHFPFGEGLEDGRCPACLALWEQRHAEQPPKPEPDEEEEEE